jgi:flavin-dependent dehydrogenase
MAEVRSTDLLIVGGGPAGLATAIEARLAGFDTMLIDRRKPPIDVACGEGLMPVGVEHLRRLGIEITDQEGSVFRGIRYLDGDFTAEARFKEGCGLGIRRSSLHRALHRRAEQIGVRLRWGVTARQLKPNGVETDDGQLLARWLVAADGRLSKVRQWSDLEGRALTRRRFGVRRHYAVAPWSEYVEVYWAHRAEAYVTPVGTNVVGVAMLSSDTPIHFDRLLQNFPLLQKRLEGAQVETQDRGAGPFGQRPVAVVRDNLALVGDASGSLDPITGEGLSIAFAQAHALVQSINSGSIEEYAAEHRRILRIPRLLTRLLLVVEHRPWLRQRMIRAFASHPLLFDDLVDLVASARPPSPSRRLGVVGFAARIVRSGV